MSLEEHRNRIVELLMSFDTAPEADLRKQVLSLVPVWNEMKNMGCALLPVTVRYAARERLLQYFQRYPFQVLSQNELSIVARIASGPENSGIQTIQDILNCIILNTTLTAGITL